MVPERSPFTVVETSPDSKEVAWFAQTLVRTELASWRRLARPSPKVAILR
jgi:hypothetical protein